MEKTYSPNAIEEKWYAIWEQHHCFQPQGEGTPYCVMLPPPNVTGKLHMGHGFQQTLMDILVRYHRMDGDKTLFQPGTDHAGISTQIVVEQHLKTQNLSRKNMRRDEFLSHAWEWKEQSGNTMAQQMRRIGTSPDWTRERFTLDEGLSAAVQKVFVQLYEEGLIYRGTRLVNWDPVLGTAISDLEVLSEEESGFLWYIKYPVVNTTLSLTIATTRPETLLGDTAVAVHPEDERYAHLIGHFIELPITGRMIPIIGDTYVDKSFGSGCVKITPAHDFNDYEIGKRHRLPSINILTLKGTLNENVPTAYQGLTCLEARTQIIEILTQEGLLEKIQPHILKVPRGEKSGAIIEPLLTEQWYVKIKPLAIPAIQAVKNGEIKFIPDNWEKTYFQWMDNIEDWCISRQLWWGHRIPAWYDNTGQVYVGYSEKDVRFRYQLEDTIPLRQDEDVLDTWFSSALWPFSTLGWPNHTPELETFYPSSILITGFDIIFFWVARMIMMGLKFTGKIPFKEVLITGLICDSEGKKMSKSKGNVLDPLDIIDGISLDALLKKRTEHLLLDSVAEKIEKMTRKEFKDGIQAFGTDALRFTYCALASTGRIIRFDLHRVEGYRNFCNKLWNATRYVLLNTEEDNLDLEDGAFQYSPADDWIVSRLQKAIADARHYLTIYRFDLLANTLYEFIWHEYCDWYLELSKPVLYSEEALAPMKRGTRRTLLHVLNQIVKLLHPICPFITEEIWQRLQKFTTYCGETIMLSGYPRVKKDLINQPLEEEMRVIQDTIQAIRIIRSEMGILPSKDIILQVKNASASDKNLIKKHTAILESLCKISQIEILDVETPPVVCASTVVHDMELQIPLAGLVNKEAELQRLSKDIQKLSKDITFLKGKLDNPTFVEQAPESVVLAHKEKFKEARKMLKKLQAHEQRIQAL